jgi:hypothetical protein
LSEPQSHLEELETEVTRLREICHDHGIDPPPDGYEAEELRKGIQKLLDAKDLNDGYDGEEMARGLQQLLDETDARDTLCVVEEKHRLEALLSAVFGTARPFDEGLAQIRQTGDRLRPVELGPTESGWERIGEQRSKQWLAHSKIAGIVMPEDAHLLERVVKYPPLSKDGPLPRWSHVSAAFSVGSTSGAALCRRFGLDPDELLGEWEEEAD